MRLTDELGAVTLRLVAVLECVSRELRAELEKLQSEVATVRVEILATEAQIPQAAVRAFVVEDTLSPLRASLDELCEENRALEQQVEWESTQRRGSFWRPENAGVGLLAFILFVISPLSIAFLVIAARCR